MEHMTDILGMLSVGSMGGIFVDMKVAMAAIIGIMLVICGLGVIAKVLSLEYHGPDYDGRQVDSTWVKNKLEKHRLDKYANYEDSDSSGERFKWKLKDD